MKSTPSEKLTPRRKYLANKLKLESTATSTRPTSHYKPTAAPSTSKMTRNQHLQSLPTRSTRLPTSTTTTTPTSPTSSTTPCQSSARKRYKNVLEMWRDQELETVPMPTSIPKFVKLTFENLEIHRDSKPAENSNIMDGNLNQSQEVLQKQLCWISLWPILVRIQRFWLGENEQFWQYQRIGGEERKLGYFWITAESL